MPKWTAVTVSKVLHRLDRTIPLIDSDVRRFYAASRPLTIRRALRDDLGANRDWVTALAAEHPIGSGPMPLTRATDIIIWMDDR